jgi:hypothetical protein
MVKNCVNCKHLKLRKRWGIVIEPACRAQAGKKWPISVALKQERCGPRRAWWTAQPTGGGNAN